MSDANLNAVSTRDLPVIAYASTHKHDAIRWTTLSMWYRTGRRPILVEVFGGTKAPGEQNRKRRRNFATVEEALAFLEPGKLRREMRAAARRWCLMNARELAPAAREPVED